MAKSAIEWTEETRQVFTGCSRESPGCENCYSEGLTATRLRGNARYAGLAVIRDNGEPQFTGEVRFHEDTLNGIAGIKKPTILFLNSMSDTFHPNVKDEWLVKVFTVLANVQHVTVQILTKRAVRMCEFMNRLKWFKDGKGKWVASLVMGETLPAKDVIPHVHMGVSVELPKYKSRVTELLAANVAVRWVSAEPLLGELDLSDCPAPYWRVDIKGINALTGASILDDFTEEEAGPNDPKLDWVVGGGESGKSTKVRSNGDPKIRITSVRWAEKLRDECVAAGVPFLWKQWGEWAPRWAVEDVDLRLMELGKPMDTRVVDGVTMYRCGKSNAMRVLGEGETTVWDQYPKGNPRAA
jgi:protein gp37